MNNLNKLKNITNTRSPYLLRRKFNQLISNTESNTQSNDKVNETFDIVKDKKVVENLEISLNDESTLVESTSDISTSESEISEPKSDVSDIQLLSEIESESESFEETNSKESVILKTQKNKPKLCYQYQKEKKFLK